MFAGHQPNILVFNVPYASEGQGEQRNINCHEAQNWTDLLHLWRALSHTAEIYWTFPETPKVQESIYRYIYSGFLFRFVYYRFKFLSSCLISAIICKPVIVEATGHIKFTLQSFIQKRFICSKD
jgi:hypothetical protein